MQESEPTELYEEVTQPQETQPQEEVHLDTIVQVFHWTLVLYFEYSCRFILVGFFKYCLTSSNEGQIIHFAGRRRRHREECDSSVRLSSK